MGGRGDYRVRCIEGAELWEKRGGSSGDERRMRGLRLKRQRRRGRGKREFVLMVGRGAKAIIELSFSWLVRYVGHAREKIMILDSLT